MNAFLGEGRVVDNPGLDLPLRLDRRQDQFARLGQNRLVRPSRLADQMQKRLMLAETRAGARIAAIGSTLLRSPGINRPMQ